MGDDAGRQFRAVGAQGQRLDGALLLQVDRQRLDSAQVGRRRSAATGRSRGRRRSSGPPSGRPLPSGSCRHGGPRPPRHAPAGPVVGFRRPVAGFQTRRMPSVPPVARKEPSGANARALTGERAPSGALRFSRIRAIDRVATSQRITRPSLLPEASRRPSGEKASEVTVSVWSSGASLSISACGDQFEDLARLALGAAREAVQRQEPDGLPDVDPRDRQQALPRRVRRVRPARGPSHGCNRHNPARSAAGTSGRARRGGRPGPDRVPRPGRPCRSPPRAGGRHPGRTAGVVVGPNARRCPEPPGDAGTGPPVAP